MPLSGLPRVFVRASHAQACKRLSVRSTQPASAQHSPRVWCQIRKEREIGSASKMRRARGSAAATHSGSSPGSPWHRQLASSRRSLTFSAPGEASARRPSRRFLDITVNCCCPAQLPCITHNSPAWRGQRVARPRRAGAAAGPGGPPSRHTLSALYGARPRAVLAPRSSESCRPVPPGIR